MIVVIVFILTLGALGRGLALAGSETQPGRKS